MPRTISGSKRKHPHIDKLTLFASPDSKGIRSIWQCRASFGRARSPVRSLELDYIKDDPKNLAKAERKAADWFYELEKDWRLGLPLRKTSVASAAEQYIEEALEGLKQNRELDEIDSAKARPRRLIPGGSSAWNKENFRQSKWVIENLITCYSDFRHGDLRLINFREIQNWSEWRSTWKQKELNRRWTSGTLNKQNRVLRSVFKWARMKGLIDTIPEIKDVPESLRNSRRPEMTQHQYTTLLQYIENKYINEKDPALERVYQRLFYLWLCTIDATGVRPWKDAKNAIKMRDIDIKMTSNAKDVEHIIIRRKEKGREYSAVADKQWLNIYEDILAIRKAWGVTSEYLFAHPVTIEKRRIIKNEPVLSFRGQWRRAVEELGFAKKGDPQQKRIAPYSIRHRYAARRYLYNKDITLEDLAQVMGSSPRVLYEVYWHYKATDNYQDLVAHGYQLREGRVRLLDDYGIRIKNVDANSEEHKAWYEKYPRFTVPPSNE
ncbi:MAG: hypothetical protein ABR85_07085 [OM182 bacterium BACL3 MAG-120619-bin3]|jgi:hypothetical protein|uniref:Tyr recombinase domain-containing protein n=1 Tax=OM182 bacterium BACL3 MAG-120619-bin3 TaxID=1655593 RepID=A0A0R2SV42_9GAMM|nr:MAG: hypothetical protein ABR85_07085 [OM182 bacterium BACL3 MAG-120619-bin3]